VTEAIAQGHFYVADLPDGKVVAASNHAPYFCFRAETEEAVLAKVDAALVFYFSGEHRQMAQRPAARVHSWANRRAVPFRERVPVAA
jgi:predicted RNase H-like HicB family nuclease